MPDFQLPNRLYEPSLERLMHLPEKAQALFSKSFGGEPSVVARAPGRIEFIGNHTDYNCGMVMGASIDRSVAVAARARSDGRFAFVSDSAVEGVTIEGRPLQPRSRDSAWINYPLGVVVALESRGIGALDGLELAVVSDLPPGAGLSSSAALELATALAVCALQKRDLPREEVVAACREAENRFVGVPCGILDQGVSGFGRRDHLVRIDCRGPRFSTVPLPAGVEFWIFNTHKKHALVDSLYATRHRECMEAARALQLRFPSIQCLADATVEQVVGADDVLTAEQRKRARHVVEEIARVARVEQALAAGDLRRVGQALFSSHESSRTQFENSTPELDFLVETLRLAAGVWGARLTGGGFGGAVMAMTDASFDAAAAARIADAYAARFSDRPDIVACATADGAELVRG